MNLLFYNLQVLKIPSKDKTCKNTSATETEEVNIMNFSEGFANNENFTPLKDINILFDNSIELQEKLNEIKKFFTL